jgi:hypothetical protein
MHVQHRDVGVNRHVVTKEVWSDGRNVVVHAMRETVGHDSTSRHTGDAEMVEIGAVTLCEMLVQLQDE